jgi:hypothetical protein
MHRVWTYSSVLLGMSLIAAGTARGQMAMCSGFNGFTFIGLVKSMNGNPFQADLESTLPTGTAEIYPFRVVNTESVARDRQGRIRVDRYADSLSVDSHKGQETGRERHFVDICDPVGLQTITLDALNKTATVQKMSSPVKQFASTGAVMPSFCEIELRGGEGLPNRKFDDLGNRIINGVETQGVVQRYTFANLRDTRGWCSEELGTVLLVEVENVASSWVPEIEMTNIRRGEPDGNLFVIPPDYKIVDRVLGYKKAREVGFLAILDAWIRRPTNYFR